MINIEQAIELAEKYGIDVNKVKKCRGRFFYVDEEGAKKQINPEDFTEEMKCLDFQLSNGFLIADEIKGDIILNECFEVEGE